MKTLLVLAVVLAVCAAYTVPQIDISVKCQMCKLVVDKYVNSADKDVTTIKKDFDTECKDLFHTIPFGTHECKKYVDEKIDPIIKELEGGTAAKDVCTKLNEC